MFQQSSVRFTEVRGEGKNTFHVVNCSQEGMLEFNGPMEQCFSRVLFLFIALLFYVHGKHLRSCRDGQLT